MLARRREQILLLIGLLVVNGLLVGRAAQLWSAHRRRAQWVYAGTNPGAAAGLRMARPNTSAPQSFAAIVDHDLFRPDRNVQRPEEAKRPDLPLLYGTMNVGEGWFALMAPANQAGASKRVLPGEEIAGYKLVSIAGSDIVVEWNSQQFTINAYESTHTVARAAEAAPGPVAARAAAPSPARAPTGQITTVGSAPGPAAASAAQQAAEYQKRFTRAGFDAPPGAPVDAPAGTIFGGKRKVVVQTPFGNSVYWVDAEKPKP